MKRPKPLFAPSLRRRIAVAFIFILVLVIATTIANYFQLRQIKPSSDLIIHYGSDIVSLQRLAVAASALDVDLERYLVIRGAEYQDSVQKDVQEMGAVLQLLQVSPNATIAPELGPLQEALTQLQAEIQKIVDLQSSNASTGEINRAIVAVYSGLDKVKELQKALSDKTLADLQSSADQQGQFAANVLNRSLALGIIVTLVVIAAALLLDRRMRSIATLTNTTTAIAGGNWDQVAPVESDDEVGKLAMSFNAMTGQLRDLVRNLEAHVIDRTTALQNRTADLENISAHMTKRATQLQAVALVGRTITSVQSLEELLPRIAAVISEQFGFYHVGIFLLDEFKTFAVLAATNSPGGQQMLKRSHKLKIGETGIVGYVADTGRPRIALDTGADAAFFNNPDLPETRSEMALPLNIGHETIGVLDVQSEQPAAFSDEDTEILAVLADQVSVAIQNARSFGEAKRALAEAEATTRQYLQQEWKMTTEEVSTSGYLYSKTSLVPISQPVETTAIKQAAESGQTSAQVELGQNHLAVPIKLRGQIVGVVNLQSDTRRKWGQDDIDIVQATAERVALALENARLFQDAQRRASKERLIGEIASKISSSTNVDGILQTAAKELGLAIPDSEVVIQFQTPENG
jgi:GAF domain-containing protein/HAMP domain-containing protein